ncbi:MAG: endonuclease/exonuclease/phosphatase family protein [Burkholderiaceae bacterium]
MSGVQVPRRLRVATYNIHKGVLNELFGLRRIPVIHELRARLHELSADLIFLQEVQGHHERHARRFEQRWPMEPQDVFLAKSPNLRAVFESAYGSNANYLHGHHGNALLSRFPILHQENRDVSDHALEKRGVLHCVIEVGSRPVHCFVVHLGLLHRSRERQIDALIEWAQRSVPASEPMIIAGDFNDWRNKLSARVCSALDVQEVFDAVRTRRGSTQRAAHYVRDRLAEMGLPVDHERWQLPRRVRAARTFPALVPTLRMDRIYQRGFRVSGAQVLGGPTWARLSDHSPLVADIEPMVEIGRVGEGG